MPEVNGTSSHSFYAANTALGSCKTRATTLLSKSLVGDNGEQLDKAKAVGVNKNKITLNC